MQSIVDECEQDETEEQCIELLEEGEDASEARQSSEQALVLVAPLVFLSVVCLGGNDGA